MIYRTDYHVHTLFSDGKAAPEDYIAVARDMGIRELGFSDHINLRYGNLHWCMDLSLINEYISRMVNYRKETGEPAIRTGLEVDYFNDMEKEIYDFLSSLRLDYVLGSVHFLNGESVDSNPDFYAGKDFDRIFRDYFDLVCEAVSSGLFDIIAHCDLVRIFGNNFSSDPAYLYEHLARTMASHDVALEINTNGMNRHFKEFYPDIRFLSVFRKWNVPVCVNSDAHFPARVGQHFDKAYLLLKDSGYNEMCTFSRRERYMIPFEF